MPPRASVQPMNVALQRPWTAEQFLFWARTQEGRFEFDGIRPVAMTGGNTRHSAVTANIHVALRSRLRGAPWSHSGTDLLVRTDSDKVRSPDALITLSKFSGIDPVAPDPVVIFEVLSPRSGHVDRIEKVREYAVVPSIRRYIIVETQFAGVMVLHRKNGGDDWLAATLFGDDILDVPEVGISLPVAEFYENVDLDEETRSFKHLMSAIREQGQGVEIAVPLDLYFFGNADRASFGRNASARGLSIPKFYEVLRALWVEPDVQDIFVRICDAGGESSWPYSDTIYILTTLSQRRIEMRLNELGFASVTEGWIYGKPPAAPEPKEGCAVYSVCWD